MPLPFHLDEMLLIGFCSSRPASSISYSGHHEPFPISLLLEHVSIILKYWHQHADLSGILALRKLLPPAESPLFVSSTRTRSSVRGYQSALTFMTIVGIVFRSELAVLLGCHAIWLLLQRRLLLQEVIMPGLVGIVIGLGLTVPLDSFFWKEFPLWPELQGFIFNVLQGKSSDWGTSPIWQYFLVDLPKLMLNPMAIFCLAFAISVPALRRTSIDILAPNLAFVAIYSLQPHKEWRFIIYVVPCLTAVAALGASWIWHRKDKESKHQIKLAGHPITIYGILAGSLYLSTALSFASSFAFLGYSSFNYPGADALNHLHALADGSQSIVSVHMDALACSTGVTRFLQVPRPRKNTTLPDGQTFWLYDKTEDPSELLRSEFWDRFDFALVANADQAMGAFAVVYMAARPRGVQLVRPGQEVERAVPGVVRTDVVWGRGPWVWLQTWLAERWLGVETFARRYLTRGWWFEVVMEPQVRVLQRIQS